MNSWIYKSAGIILLALPLQSITGELIYHPLSPSFGGSPSYTSHIMSIANAHNTHTDPDIDDNSEQTSLEEFNERLQRSVVSRITSALSGSIVGDDGSINPGSFETTDFQINVVDLGSDIIRITTIDKLTGDETIFEIDSSL